MRASLGLGIEDGVPDATTVWRFRKRLKEPGLIGRLFGRFGDYLAAEGDQAKQGPIIDASLIPVPIQRNSREEHRRRKAGAVREDSSATKGAQKDLDARWSKQYGRSTFGYKNHIDVDAAHLSVRTLDVTPAQVHNRQVLTDVIDTGYADPGVGADSAYRSAATEAALTEAGYANHIGEIGEKGQAGLPLGADQQASERQRLQIHARVECVFGFHEE